MLVKIKLHTLNFPSSCFLAILIYYKIQKRRRREWKKKIIYAKTICIYENEFRGKIFKYKQSLFLLLYIPYFFTYISFLDVTSWLFHTNKTWKPCRWCFIHFIYRVQTVFEFKYCVAVTVTITATKNKIYHQQQQLCDIKMVLFIY